MKVLAFPRDPNPYQAELYRTMAESRPLHLRYLEGPTGSQTVNVALLPVLLASFRARGFRILHVHWVYPFAMVWVRSSFARRLVTAWYLFVLAVARALGFDIVWTAHNLVPHEQTFHDDLEARQALARRCGAVIAHSDDVAATIRGWGVEHVSVVPPGAPAVADSDRGTRSAARAELGVRPDAFRVLFFGQIRPYKGVDLLLRALTRTTAERRIDVAIVGPCADAELRRELSALLADVPPHTSVAARFEFVADRELERHLAAADVAVFPFRDVTSTSSVDRALAAGLPVILPSLATLDHVPTAAAIRYDAAQSDASDALASALSSAAAMSAPEWRRRAEAATRYARGRTWPVSASATWKVFDRLGGDERISAATPRTEVPS